MCRHYLRTYVHIVCLVAFGKCVWWSGGIGNNDKDDGNGGFVEVKPLNDFCQNASTTRIREQSLPHFPQDSLVSRSADAWEFTRKFGAGIVPTIVSKCVCETDRGTCEICVVCAMLGSVRIAETLRYCRFWRWFRGKNMWKLRCAHVFFCVFRMVLLFVRDRNKSRDEKSN